jgi:preprotein translocase SecE subunit
VQKGTRVEGQKKRKPRIRKTAPTVRERAEAARADAGTKKPGRLKRSLSTAVKPIKKVRIPDNKATRPVKSVGRSGKKVLGWLIPKYFINSWQELRQVSWPNRRETWRLTLAVFVFAISLGLVVAGVDKVLEMLFRKFILSEVG